MFYLFMCTSANMDANNAISRLHERAQRLEISAPQFRVLAECGPPHARWFTVECKYEDFIAEAAARSLKTARMQAAADVLLALDLDRQRYTMETTQSINRSLLRRERDFGIDRTYQPVAWPPRPIGPPSRHPEVGFGPRKRLGVWSRELSEAINDGRYDFLIDVSAPHVESPDGGYWRRKAERMALLSRR
jgi:hypothetical protein